MAIDFFLLHGLVMLLDRVLLPGMSIVINLFELVCGEMGVNLSCGEGLMSKKLLDAAEVGTIVEHVGSEAMTEGMWADARVESSHFEVLIHFSSYASCAEPSTMLVHKEDF